MCAAAVVGAVVVAELGRVAAEKAVAAAAAAWTSRHAQCLLG